MTKEHLTRRKNKVKHMLMNKELNPNPRTIFLFNCLTIDMLYLTREYYDRDKVAGFRKFRIFFPVENFPVIITQGATLLASSCSYFLNVFL